MITAIPMKADCISSHFSKADDVVFINQQGNLIGRFPNPALGASCDGKQSLVNMLLEQGTQRVVLRNIGQQMLSKLLINQLSVFKIDSGRINIGDLGNNELLDCTMLTDVLQGRPSINHIAKQKQGGCCHHTESGAQGCNAKACEKSHNKTGCCGHH